MMIYETDTMKTYVADTTGWQLVGRTGEGRWVDYTPDITGMLPGISTATGRYTRIGNTVQFLATVTLGDDFAFLGAEVPGVTLPVPLAGKGPLSVVLSDVDTGPWIGYASYVAPSVNAYAQLPGGATGVIDATTPFDWEVGDTIEFTGSYEAA
jgi:hypothetical protein